jgi:hypothetical protein
MMRRSCLLFDTAPILFERRIRLLCFMGGLEHHDLLFVSKDKVVEE